MKFVIALLIITGWVTNLINIIVTLSSNIPISELGSYLLLQTIGVFFAPIGVILGISSWF